MGYLDALYVLLKKCRMKCRQSGNDPTLVPMWKERGARVCLIIASQLVEMKVRFFLSFFFFLRLYHEMKYSLQTGNNSCC